MIRFIKRWKYTIILGLICLLIGFGFTSLIKGSSDCSKKGGVYARTFDNRYKCVKEIK